MGHQMPSRLCNEVTNILPCPAAFLVAVSLAFDNMGTGGSFTWLTYIDIVGSECRGV